MENSELLTTLELGRDEILDNFDFDVFCKDAVTFRKEYKAAESLLNDAIEDIIESKLPFTIKEDTGLKAIATNTGMISLNYVLVDYDYNLDSLSEDVEEEDYTYFGC